MSPIFEYAAGLWREMREEFELEVLAAYQAAEAGTGGAMLNKLGRREGIDAYSLMTGPWHRVIRYGAPELIEWCETTGRPSAAKFEREWFTSWIGEEPLPEAVEFPADGVMREAGRIPAPVVQVGDPVQFKLEAPDEWPPYVIWPGLRFATVMAVHGEEHPGVPSGEYRYFLHDSEGGETLCPASWFVRARSSADF